MRIAEIFRSLQGEGRLTGTDSIFVRASGCNLRCWFCDTRYASWEPEGEELSVEEVLARAQRLARPPRDESQAPEHRPGQATRHVVITGGEPMLFADLAALAQAFRDRGWHITIETAGTVYQAVACDLMSISPKLSGSTPSPELGPEWSRRHETARQAAEVIRRLVAEYDYQLKFVVDRREDCDEVLRYLDKFTEVDRGRVMLMPQGTDAVELARKAEWLEPYCRGVGLGFCPRRHIEWFGARRGT